MYNAIVKYMNLHYYVQCNCKVQELTWVCTMQLYITWIYIITYNATLYYSREHELTWVCTKLLSSTWFNINLYDYVCIGMVCNTSGLD